MCGKVKFDFYNLNAETMYFKRPKKALLFQPINFYSESDRLSLHISKTKFIFDAVTAVFVKLSKISNISKNQSVH